ISVDAYRQFTFEGAQEIATMFAHYQTVTEWDRSIVDDLIPSYRTFEQWLKDNEKMLLDIFTELSMKEYKAPPSKIGTSVVEEKAPWTLRSLFSHRFPGTSKMSTPVALSLATQEVRRHTQRCRIFSQLRYDEAESDS
ncbi:unnamed protein product, partial [Candidula unifasciata]